MSSKRKRERPCITPGMLSTLSVFTHKPHIISVNKAQQFYFRSNDFFFIFLIFGLPTLVNHKERTSRSVFKGWYLYYSYSRKLQLAKSFSTSQKITISKNALYISENYNRQIAMKKKKNNPQEREKESRTKRKEGKRGIA